MKIMSATPDGRNLHQINSTLVANQDTSSCLVTPQFRNLPTFEEKPQKRFHHDLLQRWKGGQKARLASGHTASRTWRLSSGCSFRYFYAIDLVPTNANLLPVDGRPGRQRDTHCHQDACSASQVKNSYSSTTKMNPNLRILRLSFFTSIRAFISFIQSLLIHLLLQMLIEYLGPQQPLKALNAEM